MIRLWDWINISESWVCSRGPAREKSHFNLLKNLLCSFPTKFLNFKQQRLKYLSIQGEVWKLCLNLTVIYCYSLSPIFHWVSLREKHLDEWQEASWAMHLQKILHMFSFGHFVILFLSWYPLPFMQERPLNILKVNISCSKLLVFQS